MVLPASILCERHCFIHVWSARDVSPRARGLAPHRQARWVPGPRWAARKSLMSPCVLGYGPTEMELYVPEP